jgi:hypothetical protein
MMATGCNILTRVGQLDRNEELIAMQSRPRVPDADPVFKTTRRVGFYSAIATAVMTLITFGFAFNAVPISGPGCVEGCIEYPYLDSLAQYPKDYLWMYLALVMMVAYVIFMVALHAHAVPEKRIFAQVGLSFALMAALTLVVTYFTQAAVVPVSLLSGETDGIALFTQYNVHGLFIALEEIGYLLMSVSFLFMGLALGSRSGVESAARWVFLAAFAFTIIALVVTSILYGLDRSYRFEIAVISIDWLALIVNGILLAVSFRRHKNLQPT